MKVHKQWRKHATNTVAVIAGAAAAAAYIGHIATTGEDDDREREAITQALDVGTKAMSTNAGETTLAQSAALVRAKRQIEASTATATNKDVEDALHATALHLESGLRLLTQGTRPDASDVAAWTEATRVVKARAQRSKWAGGWSGSATSKVFAGLATLCVFMMAAWIAKNALPLARRGLGTHTENEDRSA